MKNNDSEKETETSNLVENMAKSISRRRFLTVSGVAALSAVAVACGSSESSDTTVAAPSTDAPVAEEEIGGEITLWAWGAGLEGDKTKQEWNNDRIQVYEQCAKTTKATAWSFVMLFIVRCE